MFKCKTTNNTTPTDRFCISFGSYPGDRIEPRGFFALSDSFVCTMDHISVVPSVSTTRRADKVQKIQKKLSDRDIVVRVPFHECYNRFVCLFPFDVETVKKKNKNEG